MARRRFDYDYIVIGSGVAGGSSAIMLAGAGKKVALVEADKWGGEALNYSDVPFSALFHASHLLAQSVDGAKFGLSSSSLRFNYPTLMNWKNTAMRRAGANSKKDFESAGIDTYRARAHFLSPYELSVGTKTLSARKFIIATGANLTDTGIKGLDDVDYLTPSSVLTLTRLPRTIFIVGAGSTGCELAQYFAELGVKVLIADIAGRLLPQEDEEVGQVMDDTFNSLGVKVLTQSRVVALAHGPASKKVIFLRGGQEKSVRIDEVLLCTGSAPATDIGLENAGVKYSREGIKVNQYLQTSMKHIYAAGDIIGGLSSSEKSIIDARVASSNSVNRSKLTANYSGLIRVTRTFPQIATIGPTEDDCIKRDRKVRKVIVPLGSIETSNTQDFRNGFIKLLTDRSKKIIGATIVAPNATLLAQEIAMALRYGLTAQELADVPHVASDWGELVRIAASRLS